MKILLDIELTQYEKEKINRVAIIEGFVREDPRKAWTEKEEKDALRFGIQNIIKYYIDNMD